MQAALAPQSDFCLQSKDAAKRLLSFSSTIASNVFKLEVLRTSPRQILRENVFIIWLHLTVLLINVVIGRGKLLRRTNNKSVTGKLLGVASFVAVSSRPVIACAKLPDFTDATTKKLYFKQVHNFYLIWPLADLMTASSEANKISRSKNAMLLHTQTGALNIKSR